MEGLGKGQSCMAVSGDVELWWKSKNKVVRGRAGGSEGGGVARQGREEYGTDYGAEQ